MEDGSFKFGDLGSSKYIEDILKTITIDGTVNYFAPEIL